MRRFQSKILILVTLLSVLLLSYHPVMLTAKEILYQEVENEDPVAISSKSAILIELNSGKVIYEKNAEELLRPASVTKVMTLLLIFEAMDAGKFGYDDTVTISEHAASMGGSQCFFESGEQQTVRDMIKCIEIASGNDAAVAMAEYVAGSEEAFVALMNQRAKELGMEHTHFDNACGLEVETHLTCAKDIAIMSRQLIKYHPEILEFSTIWMDSITHKTKRGESRFDLANTNKFLNLYTGANGLKTGYTSQAKYCMSASACRNDIQLIAVIMGAETKDIRNQEAMKLLDYGFAKCKNYTDQNPLGEQKEFQVKNGTASGVRLKDTGEYTITMVDMDENKLEKQILPYKELNAPIYKGDAVGVVQYAYEGELLSEFILYADEDIPKNNMKYSFSRIMSRLFMVK